MLAIKSFAECHKGLVRQANEDSYILNNPTDKQVLKKFGVLAIVADGVGGGPYGKEASSSVVQSIKERFYSDDRDDRAAVLTDSLSIANTVLYAASCASPHLKGMATTCTAAAILGRHVHFCHIGDSRAYIFRNGSLSQLTKDHTIVGELVAEGIITREEARLHPDRNLILKAMGSSAAVEPFCISMELAVGDIVLLCSDGLCGCVEDSDIESELNKGDVDKAGNKLVKLALDKGGPDNITVVLIKIKKL